MGVVNHNDACLRKTKYAAFSKEPEHDFHSKTPIYAP